MLKYPCRLLALSWELGCLVGSSFRKVLELVSCCFLVLFSVVKGFVPEKPKGEIVSFVGIFRVMSSLLESVILLLGVWELECVGLSLDAPFENLKHHDQAKVKTSVSKLNPMWYIHAYQFCI